MAEAVEIGEPLSDRVATILAVEDDEVDVMMLERTLRRHAVPAPLVVVNDGLAALARLRGTDGDPPLERPYILLLDLNMPRMNGLEFLAELRRDPSLRDTVVFVLTTSDDDADIRRAYAHAIAGYFCKGGLSQYQGVADLLTAYLKVAELPH